jgi:hypothetical protein
LVEKRIAERARRLMDFAYLRGAIVGWPSAVTRLGGTARLGWGDWDGVAHRLAGPRGMYCASKRPSLNRSTLEKSALEEWRRLCFVLEGLQATGLLNARPDKYTLARTYVAYQRGFEESVAGLEQAIDRGEFGFFTDRGVPSDIMSPGVARDLLRVWRGAIASKLERVAVAFSGRFGEDI